MRRRTIALLLVVVTACYRGSQSRRPPIHLNPNMDRQQKYRPQAESRFFRNGTTMQQAVAGTIARGELRENEELFNGKNAFGVYAANPLPATNAVIARGRERFAIYCTPCHGPRGDGKGILLTRGGVKSRDLHEDAVRSVPDGRLFEIISKGSGLMPGYRAQIPVSDRWAIVAYVRTLR